MGTLRVLPTCLPSLLLGTALRTRTARSHGFAHPFFNKSSVFWVPPDPRRIDSDRTTLQGIPVLWGQPQPFNIRALKTRILSFHTITFAARPNFVPKNRPVRASRKD